MLRHMGQPQGRWTPCPWSWEVAVSPGTALALYLRMIPLTAMGNTRFYIKLEWIQTISQLSPQFHPPYCLRDHRFDQASHDRHWKGKSSPASPWFLVTQALFQRLFLSSLHPTLIPACPPFVLFSPCVGLRKECRTSRGFRKANGKWLLDKLKTTGQA